MSKLIKSRIIYDILFYIAGGIVYAVGLNCFIAPNDIAPGGATGLGIIINHLINLPIGTVAFIINIPLFIIGYFKLSLRDIIQSFIAMSIMSVMIDISHPILPPYTGNDMVAALFGGIITGAGLALVLMRGATTGGSDLAAQLLHKRFASLSIGKLLLIIDVIIITASVLVFKNIESALYAVISIFVCTYVIDSILYRTGSGQLMFIITEKYEQTSDVILNEIQRGVTRISATGGFSGKEQVLLMCAVRKHELYRLKSRINKIDPQAFIIVTDTSEISGKGFFDKMP